MKPWILDVKSFCNAYRIEGGKIINLVLDDGRFLELVVPQEVLEKIHFATRDAVSLATVVHMEKK